MRSPAFWAAVRLIAFANLPISQKNWRSLWWSSRADAQRMIRAVIPVGLGTRVVLRGDHFNERLRAHYQLLLAFAHEVWRYAKPGHETEVLRLGSPRREEAP